MRLSLEDKEDVIGSQYFSSIISLESSLKEF